MSNTTPGGKREKLIDALPLQMPYLIQIFPVYACNFKCGYCIHSLDKAKHGYISDVVNMPLDLFKKIIDDIKSSGIKIKMLRFAAIGEPLLHPQIADMVAYAKKADVAESVDIVTNGALLTHELSQKLINAGLSKLRISLEGLSSEEYKKNSSADIDFDSFVENIAYFHERSGDTKMYIKIIDYMAQKEEEQKRFFDIFSNITDDIAIEHLTPTIEEIDYGVLSGGMVTDKPQNGEKLLEAQICPQPFYLMQINPDGNVVPCCSMKYPRILGNVKEDSVQAVWLGEKFNTFRRELLNGVKTISGTCSRCNLYLYDLHEEDVLDAAKDQLEKVYE